MEPRSVSNLFLHNPPPPSLYLFLIALWNRRRLNGHFGGEALVDMHPPLLLLLFLLVVVFSMADIFVRL